MAVTRASLSWAGAPRLSVSTLGQAAGWVASPDVVDRASRQQPGFNFDETKVHWFTALAADPMPSLDTPVVVGQRGYHVRSGGHDLAVYDSIRFREFADRMWRR